jgi:Ciliary basal body-associated, B9 protein
MSQISKKGKCHMDESQLCIWNLPIELTLKSTNISGCKYGLAINSTDVLISKQNCIFLGPKIVVSVYGTDAFGNDIVRGYAWNYVPLESTSCNIV